MGHAGALLGLLLSVLWLCSCGSPPVEDLSEEKRKLALKDAAERTKADEVALEDELIRSTFSHCTPEPATEQPIAEETAGNGDRFVQVENAGKVELRARLVFPDGTPAVPGTLRIPPMTAARFLIPVGSYALRIREEERCTVMRGEPFTITEDFEGAFVAIEFTYDLGTVHSFFADPDPL
jgi:hypothetical protein